MRRLSFLLLLAYPFASIFLIGPVDAQVPTTNTTLITPNFAPNDALIGGTREFFSYRIPGFAAAQDGSLMVFAEARPNGADPGGTGNNDLVYIRSTDKGQTWTDYEVLNSSPGTGFDYSDPRVVVDSGGKVHLQYVQWPTGIGQANTGPGFNENQTSLVFYQTSTDNGVTWTAPLDISMDVKESTWNSINTGPGLGIELKWQTAAQGEHNGRLVMPAHMRPGSSSSDIRGVSLYSDDNGANWNHTPTSGANSFADESEVIELTDGRLMWDGRQRTGNARERYISTDGGETWGADIGGGVPVSPVDTGILRYSAQRSGDDRDRILYSAPLESLAGGGNRQHIGIWTSYDEGQTYINPVQIEEGSAAYSSIDKLNDGSIGLIYETEGARTIRYVNFNLDQVEGAAQLADTTHYDGFDNVIARDNGGVGWSGEWQRTDGAQNFTDDTATQFGDGSSVTFDGFKFDKRDGRLDLLAGGSNGSRVERDLSQTIDLNSNETHYASLLFSNRLDNSQDSASFEFLDIEFLDGNGASQAAFGVGSDESFFVTGLGTSAQSTLADALLRDEDYLLVAKIISQDDASGSNFDQIFLKTFESGDAIPDFDDGLNWTLAGLMDENSDALLETISLHGGGFSFWSVDELRIGNTWGSVASNVAAVPEPSSASLLGLLALGWLGRRKRNSFSANP